MNSAKLVDDYLARLEVEARRLPPDRAQELVADIRGHIEIALAESGSDEAAVRTVLDRLGTASAIVDAELGNRDRDAGSAAPSPGSTGRPAQRWGAVEVAAALLLTLGMILLPVFGPLLGLGLVWVSSYWTTREKIVVTAVVLILLIVPVLGLLAVGGGSGASSPGPVSIEP